MTRERENLSQAGRGTEGIKLIFKLQNYKVIQFKYEMSVAEFRVVRNADYEKAVTKDTDNQN